VQLGRRSIAIEHARRLLRPGTRIGASVHSVGEAFRAADDGADFVLLGTIYASASHPEQAGAEQGGVSRVTEVTSRIRLPVIAIGGITPSRVGEVMAAGAWGAAVLGGVWRAANPVAAVDAYIDAVRARLVAGISTVAMSS
jgi:thiazole tautomerase (transcriptional regulator TenI)